jgi:phage/plasmid-associated DNA primase
LTITSLRLREKEFRFEVAESMRMAKKRYRIEKDSVLAFISEKISKSDEKDKLKLSEVYEKYLLFCKSENYKNIEKKVDFRKTLEKCKYHIANSTKDLNQVFIFGAKLNED